MNIPAMAYPLMVAAVFWAGLLIFARIDRGRFAQAREERRYEAELSRAEAAPKSNEELAPYMVTSFLDYLAQHAPERVGTVRANVRADQREQDKARV